MVYEKIAIVDQYLTLSPKRYKVELLWEANRKPYPSFRVVPFSLMLSDPKPRFQGHNIIECQTTRKWYNRELHLQW